MKRLFTAAAITVMLAVPASAGGFGGSDRSAPGPFHNHHDDNLVGPQKFAAGLTRYVISKKIRKLNDLRVGGYVDRRIVINKIKELRRIRREIINYIND